MRLVVVRVLGLDLLDVEVSTGEDEAEGCSLDGGTTASTPISFAAVDGRWERGTDHGAGEPEDGR